jgi:hypothetical protein
LKKIFGESEMTDVFQAQFQGGTIQFNRDGWVDASGLANRYGLDVNQWLKTTEAQRYQQQLGELSLQYIFVLVEPDKSECTWMHPKLAVEFARNIDLKLAVWCDFTIESILRPKTSERERLIVATKRLAEEQRNASKNGRALAKWRWSKKGLEEEVGYWNRQLQLSLGLDSPN